MPLTRNRPVIPAALPRWACEKQRRQCDILSRHARAKQRDSRGEWNGYQVSNEHVMNYTDVDGMRYFWVTVKGLDNDRMYGYYFLVDGKKRWATLMRALCSTRGMTNILPPTFSPAFLNILTTRFRMCLSPFIREA